MVKAKILWVIALYIILGIIAFFNFGLYRYLTKKPEWKIKVYDDVREGLDGNIQTPQAEPAKESQGSPTDMEINTETKN